jgi:hypothetical protein
MVALSVRGAPGAMLLSALAAGKMIGIDSHSH